MTRGLGGANALRRESARTAARFFARRLLRDFVHRVGFLFFIEGCLGGDRGSPTLCPLPEEGGNGGVGVLAHEGDVGAAVRFEPIGVGGLHRHRVLAHPARLLARVREETVNPTQNAQDSVIMGGAGQGQADQQRLRQLAEQWSETWSGQGPPLPLKFVGIPPWEPA